MTKCHFVISAFDLNFWCTILECRFSVDDMDALRLLIEPDDDDHDLNRFYVLDANDVAALNLRFSTGFPIDQLANSEIEIYLTRYGSDEDCGSLRETPYLVHTNFELPMMLDGRKKLARFTGMWSKAEEAFDKWVECGFLHKEVIVKPVPQALKPYAVASNRHDTREVYYTLKGEEWRIPAMELLWEAGTTSGGGGWNEHHERLEGMLFGYESWQNNWWIEDANRKNGGIGGVPFCCGIDADGLAWMQSAGYKALPPSGPDEFWARVWRRDDQSGMAAFLAEDERSVALARFKLLPKAQQRLFPLGKNETGRFLIKRSLVPEINLHLRRQIDIVFMREL